MDTRKYTIQSNGNKNGLSKVGGYIWGWVVLIVVVVVLAGAVFLACQAQAQQYCLNAQESCQTHCADQGLTAVFSCNSNCQVSGSGGAGSGSGSGNGGASSTCECGTGTGTSNNYQEHLVGEYFNSIDEGLNPESGRFGNIESTRVVTR